ncbi:unnamed protein product [Clonostachys byssicola]|uniref:RING-type domain-containing protein n=1 Tax=Clonostachys byssicola TaxID=160290 RepID=A0A9N9U5E5_9HYPO|nr:unnamed protein product [Clonostachys byssicola]
MEILGPSSIREFIQRVSSVFPGISSEFLQSLGGSFRHDTEAAINHLIDEEEHGRPYRRSQMKQANGMKRKRDENVYPLELEPLAVGVAEQGHDGPRIVPTSPDERLALSKLLHQEYPCVPHEEIDKLLLDHQYCLRSAYFALDTLVYTWYTLPEKPFVMVSDPSSIQKPFLNPRNHQAMISVLRAAKGFKKKVLQELFVCWKMRYAFHEQRQGKPSKNMARDNTEVVVGEDVIECQCCFIECPLHQMVHCEGEVTHFFCVQCIRQYVGTLIGLSKHELVCISMDKCDAGFSQAERSKFLDDKLTKALDKIEAAAVLLLANLEGLVHCPFCNYAAQCPPIEEDREFRCANSECEIVSCRLCQKETHTPQTCDESAREKGYSARREIEEAMSAALIRKCNKCRTPFVKDIGCNKMTCPKQACRNVQCYICSKNCDYRHFNDPNRGGKKGNCPLFDKNVESRHESEVKNAEDAAREAVSLKQPDVDPSLLKFDMSSRVFEDDKRRKQGTLRPRGHYRGARRLEAEPLREIALPAIPHNLAQYQEQFHQRELVRQRQRPQPAVAPPAVPGIAPFNPIVIPDDPAPAGRVANWLGSIPFPAPQRVGPNGQVARKLFDIAADIDPLPGGGGADIYDPLIGQKVNAPASAERILREVPQHNPRVNEYLEAQARVRA